MPGEQGVRAYDRSDLAERSATQLPRLGRQPNPLVVGKPQAARTELHSKNAILGLEIVDHFALLLVNPARQGNNQEPERVRQRRPDAQSSRSDEEPPHGRIIGHYDVESRLDRRSRQALERHLTDCPRCQEFLDSYRVTPGIVYRATKTQLSRQTARRLLSTVSR